jgi:hypothetical protein
MEKVCNNVTSANSRFLQFCETVSPVLSGQYGIGSLSRNVGNLVPIYAA